MVQTTTETDLASPQQRSRLSNNPRKLPGVDGRTASARRYRDLVHEVLAEFGEDAPTTKVRELATLRMTLETTQGSALAGDPSAANDLIRLSNAVCRLERALRARRKPSRRLSLAEQLAHDAQAGNARR